ncbi:MAG: PH domain-containing protein, partial [Arenimonas sp.]
RDSKFQQSFFERMAGLGEIELYSTDETSPTIRLPYIADAEAVREKIRALVEARRDAKRVRYLDAE